MGANRVLSFALVLALNRVSQQGLVTCPDFAHNAGCCIPFSFLFSVFSKTSARGSGSNAANLCGSSPEQKPRATGGNN